MSNEHRMMQNSSSNGSADTDDEVCKKIYSNAMKLMHKLTAQDLTPSFDEFHYHYRRMQEIMNALYIQLVSKQLHIECLYVVHADVDLLAIYDAILYFSSNMDRIFDMKCISEKRCWYCKNLCDYCLQPAAFGLCYPSSLYFLKFCAKGCERHFICPETQLQITIQLIPLHTDSVQEVEFIPNEHQELFRIQGHLVLSEHLLLFI